MWNSNGGGSKRERQAFPAVRQQTPAAPLLAAATPHLRAAERSERELLAIDPLITLISPLHL